MPRVTVVADYQNLCGECPVWNHADGTLEWIDCVGLKFFRLHWATRQHSLLKQDLPINGFRRNRPGGYVITNNEGVWHWDGYERFSRMAAEAEGSKCQLNDCIADARGRLLAGSYFYNPSADYELGKLIRVDTDGKASVLDDGFHLANGLGFSLDGRTLYFTDSAARRIYAYDYQITTGSARNRRVFAQVPKEEGLPDGLAVDRDGFVWSAQWYGSCIVRYDPEGKVERRVPIPAKQVSSLAFGGPELTDIFVTSAGQSEIMPIMPPGYDPKTGYFGGALFHLNLGIAGQPSNVTDITL
ncbi:MAG: SMP-30/gluconolactonase/LRE family protein [Terriglobia bacterium]|jgi:D-xylonolactonase